MTKWELARYLIDAKKCVDSVIFIEQNSSSLKNIDIYEKVNSKRDKFYIKCCYVLDDIFNKREKKELRENDDIIHHIYYERDKNSAHKDIDYKPKKYNSLKEMISDLKKQIIHVKELCKDYLPEVISLDFVSHDKELFRLVKGINADKEERINKNKYPIRDIQTVNEGKSYTIFQDTENIRHISEQDKNNYATLFENGINDYEGLQNMQDSCIKTNVLLGLDMWCTLNEKDMKEKNELKSIGLIDEYNTVHLELLDNPEIFKKLIRFIEADKTKQEY